MMRPAAVGIDGLDKGLFTVSSQEVTATTTTRLIEKWCADIRPTRIQPHQTDNLRKLND
ncbi:hypothetical protein [Oceaniovalibus sp. ACAM 378]|uniref:hypothetical protein n=1 Tax=Oceaniovalibus sp. ACAM 378 TaxID=2599923 RepID=UPI0016520A97|nr:hypothetical protein [Oceaniovalibus sp. ACAM 378]